jgi:hypothetical protein
MSFDSVPLRGRRHVLELLGLAPDATDEIVPVAPIEGLQAVGDASTLAVRTGRA